MKLYTVAVLGATGAVGQEMMKILEERNFPVAKLIPLASARSAGKTLRRRHLGKALYRKAVFNVLSAKRGGGVLPLLCGGTLKGFLPPVKGVFKPFVKQP